MAMKPFILSLLAAQSILFAGCVANEDTIASWTFDRLEDGAAIDSASGRKAMMVSIGKAPEFKDGLYGKALLMRGGDNMMEVAHADELAFADSFTIKCVFQADRVNGYHTLLWKGFRGVRPQEINYYLDVKDGLLEFKFKDEKGDWVTTASTKPDIKEGQWIHATVTFDKGKVEGWINGKRSFSTTCKLAQLLPNKRPLYIGAGEDFNYPFDGLIEKVEIEKGVKPPTKEEIDEFNAKVKERQAAKNAEERRESIAAVKSAGEGQNAKSLESLPIEELRKLAAKADYARFFKSHADGNPVIVSSLPTSSRILSAEPYVKGELPLTKRIELEAARNEYEGFQAILLGSPDKPATGIKITLADLRSADGKTSISKDCIEWGYVRSIKSDMPEYYVDYVGDYPDVIMEGQADYVEVKAEGFTPVYFRIKVGESVAAGDYSGKVLISCDGKAQSVEIKLKVYGFTLPKTNSLNVVFSFFENFYATWYGIDQMSDAQRKYITDFMLKYRLSPNNIYDKDINPTLKTLPALKKEGANFCTIGYFAPGKRQSEAELAATVRTVKANYDAVKKAGCADMAYFFAYDEIQFADKSLHDSAKQMMPAIKKAIPELRTVQTSYPTDELADLFDIWVPLFNNFSGAKYETIKKFQAKGVKFWWYTADTPRKPFPNFFLDYPVFDNRIIMTLSYMYGVEGVLYWAINREWRTNEDIRGQWPEKPWKPYIISVANNKRQFKNGMGNYVYPGKDGRILPSLRLENLRDGVEDYEYLAMLKGLAAELRRRHGESSLVKDAERLLAVPPAVATSIRSYSPDPENLLNYRRQVASMIEEAGRQLK